jgi:thiaminase
MTTTNPQSVTAHLLALDPGQFQTATQATFLEKAGKGTLSKEMLQEWLSQDRLYAQAYLRFASLLLANIPLPSTVSPNHINERLVDLIVDAVTNIRRELKFFEDVARRYGLDIEANVVSPGAQSYQRLFSEIGEGIEEDTHGIIDGLALLWATEKCYLESWTYASTFCSPAVPPEQDLDGGALRNEFIPNWTSTEFVRFVDRCAELVDEVWTGQQGEGNGELLERGVWRLMGTGREKEKERLEWLKWMESFWGKILATEKIFWLDVEDY